MTETATQVVIDSFGQTDPGKVRQGNEDHFVIATVRKSVEIRYTSLADDAVARRLGRATGHLFAVADGVGGRPEGDLASERAVTALLDYIVSAAECFQGLDTTREDALLVKLEETVLGVHDALVRDYGGVNARLPATTLTMALLVWPRAYLVHVGDSRAYVRQRGRLQRLTRDQTLGEFMVDAGAWTEAQAARSSAASTLSSAVGGTEIVPVVGLIDLEPGDALLLCTDGLTRHVPDERIAAVLDAEDTAESYCRQLIDDALAGGGSDNITVVAVTTRPAGGRA
jgi:serine/threonine protein phosphatase PrpC